MQKVIKSLVFVFLFLLFTNAFSQDFKYKNYYINTTKAEQEIIKSDYQKALKFYQEAFKELDRYFATDLFNAVLCAEKSENHAIAFQYLEKLIDKGLSLEVLSRKICLSHLQKRKEWKKLKHYAKKNSERIQESKDKVLLAKLIKLAEDDQACRVSLGYAPEYKDSIKSIDYKNYNILVKIIKENGFPSENDLGLSALKQQNIPFYIVVHHAAQQKFEGDLWDLLLKAVKNGELHPFVYAKLLDLLYSSSPDYASMILHQIDTNYYTRKFSEDRLEEINKKREYLGLGTVQNYLDRTIYQVQNKSCFIIRYGFGVHHVSSERVRKRLEEQAKKNFIKVSMKK